MSKLNKIFSKPRLIGLVANTNEGKSNTLYYIIRELKKDYNLNIYTFGLRCEVSGTQKIYSVSELEQIKDSVIIVDELFSLFDLDNRKIKAQVENTIRLIFHNNNVLLLSGLGENFKKFLSAKLSAVIFKKITLSDLINGSSVKNIIMNYKGPERGSTMLNLPIDKAVVYDGKHYYKIDIPYLKEYDTKKDNVTILVRKNVLKKIPKRV